MPFNHLILCHPLLLLPSVFPSIRIFSNKSAFCISWPKYWSFSFSISPSNEYSGLISFRMDWFDLLINKKQKSQERLSSDTASIHWFAMNSTVVQFSSVPLSCPALCDPTDCSTPGFPVHHQIPEFTQTHVHGVSDAIQPSHPLSSPSPPTFSLSQHQGLFKWADSSPQVAQVLEFHL